MGAVNKIKPVSIRAQGRVRERELRFSEIRVSEIFIGDASARHAQQRCFEYAEVIKTLQYQASVHRRNEDSAVEVSYTLSSELSIELSIKCQSSVKRVVKRVFNRVVKRVFN